jgi:hypothetical protein
MGVLQVNIFSCELCGKLISLYNNVGFYDDPIIIPPKDWGFIPWNDSCNKLNDEKFVCPECLKIYKTTE